MHTTYDIFISYPHKHRDWVRSFVEALEKYNLIPIVSEDVPVGELVTPIRRRRWITKSDPLANANEVARLFSQNGGNSMPISDC
jgi:hypothetical protein